jgi:hypothetical protein
VIDKRALTSFVIESNSIEGITRTRADAVEAHQRFLAQDRITVADLEALVDVLQPGARLRCEVGMDVRVGNYVAPAGGPEIEHALQDILMYVNTTDARPYPIHQRYERLHPFIEGNGRSGRALWLWQMIENGHGARALKLGFLHSWYYQSLGET